MLKTSTSGVFVPDSVIPAGTVKPFAALQYMSQTLNAELMSADAVFSQEYLTPLVITADTKPGIPSLIHTQDANALGPGGHRS